MCNSRARSPLRGRSSNLPPWARERHLILCLFLVHSRDTHVARRHYGGNRVLVDHLADAIAQQDDELIEGIDLPLQLDAIHEVNRDGHLLLTQRIQKRVLKRLTLGHTCSPDFFLFNWRDQSGPCRLGPLSCLKTSKLRLLRLNGAAYSHNRQC